MSLDSNDAITRCIWTEYDVTEGLEVKFTVTGKITQHLGGPLVVPKGSHEEKIPDVCSMPSLNHNSSIISRPVAAFPPKTGATTFLAMMFLMKSQQMTRFTLAVNEGTRETRTLHNAVCFNKHLLQKKNKQNT